MMELEWIRLTFQYVGKKKNGTYVNPMGYASQLLVGEKKQKEKIQKRRDLAHLPFPAISYEPEESDSEEAAQRLTRMELLGTRIEVYWTKQQAGGGRAGYYPGEIVGMVEGANLVHGDHLILYDDSKDGQPIFERLFDGVMPKAIWRLE